MNVTFFSGNLGKDCRTGNVGGKPVCNFSVAMTEGYGDRKKTHWMDCALWGKQAEALAPYLVKGQKVVISGELGLREATDKYPATMTCRVEHIDLVGAKAEPADKQPKPAAKPPAGNGPAVDDDIPF